MLAYIPPATRTLLLLNVAAFLLEWLLANLVGHSPALGTGGSWPFLLFVILNPEGPLALWPLGPHFGVWQIITYAFLHGGWEHIFFNMFALWMFGSQLERFWGGRRFVSFYFASVIAAAAMQLLVTSWLRTPYATVGASGGIFGLLLGFAMYFPRQRIMLIFPPIPMPAWLFVTLYGALELFLGVTGTEAGVAHFAHLGGMLGGWLTILSWRRRAPTSRASPRL